MSMLECIVLVHTNAQREWEQSGLSDPFCQRVPLYIGAAKCVLV